MDEEAFLALAMELPSDEVALSDHSLDLNDGADIDFEDSGHFGEGSFPLRKLDGPSSSLNLYDQGYHDPLLGLCDASRIQHTAMELSCTNIKKKLEGINQYNHIFSQQLSLSLYYGCSD